MTEIVNLLSHYSESELRDLATRCEKDLHDAAQLANNTEWHEACFAAMYTICEEMNRRGIKPKAVGAIQ